MIGKRVTLRNLIAYTPVLLAILFIALMEPRRVQVATDGPDWLVNLAVFLCGTPMEIAASAVLVAGMLRLLLLKELSDPDVNWFHSAFSSSILMSLWMEKLILFTFLDAGVYTKQSTLYYVMAFPTTVLVGHGLVWILMGLRTQDRLKI